MTKKIFYQFVIKTIGLFTLKDFIETIFQSISLVFYDSSMNIGTFLSVLSVLFFLTIKVGIFYACIFKTDKIIEFLKLADDETVLSDWYFDMNTLLSIAIIVIGLLQMIDALPTLIRELVVRFKEKDSFAIFVSRDKFLYIYPAVKAAIGFLLISNYKLLIRWIHNTSETREPTDIKI